MRLRSLQFLRMHVPLKRKVRHAAHARTENDSLFVRCETEGGLVGWGEGLPRDYVTGEKTEDLWRLLPQLDCRPWQVDFQSLEQLRARLTNWKFPTETGSRDSFGNSVRCAIELALLDVWSQERQQPLWETIRQLAPPTVRQADVPTTLRFTAVLTSASDAKLMLMALAARAYGFRQVKLKVGGPAAAERKLVQRVRCTLGKRIELRVDANGAWTADELPSRLEMMQSLGISSVEQPLPHSQVESLNGIRGRGAVPVMLDESLCSLTDAVTAIQRERCDAFNVRLSKCGGVLNSLEMMRLAQEAGLNVQLGCMVGETGILSAAGRHFAAAVSELHGLEGSNDRFLFRTRLTKEDLTWGYGGIASVLQESGLGIHVQDAVRAEWQQSAIDGFSADE